MAEIRQCQNRPDQCRGTARPPEMDCTVAAAVGDHRGMAGQRIGDAGRQFEPLGVRDRPGAHHHVGIGAQGLRVHESGRSQPSASIRLAAFESEVLSETAGSPEFDHPLLLLNAIRKRWRLPRYTKAQRVIPAPPDKS